MTLDVKTNSMELFQQDEDPSIKAGRKILEDLNREMDKLMGSNTDHLLKVPRMSIPEYPIDVAEFSPEGDPVARQSQIKILMKLIEQILDTLLPVLDLAGTRIAELKLEVAELKRERCELNDTKGGH